MGNTFMAIVKIFHLNFSKIYMEETTHNFPGDTQRVMYSDKNRNNIYDLRHKYNLKKVIIYLYFWERILFTCKYVQESMVCLPW